MTVFKCDRCGIIYEKNGIRKTGTTSYKFKGVAVILDNESTEQTFDLCDQCMTDFISFMVKPSEVEK